MYEALNKHFTGLAKQLLGPAPAATIDFSKLVDFVTKSKSPGTADIQIPPMTIKQTEQIIKDIPSGKATGADGLSIRLIKLAASVIAPSLTKLMNHCMLTGSFPAVWKIAKVIPLHKSGDKSNKNNYRPVSILPVLSKVLERHMHNTL
jgi:hypothetical protein